MRFYAVVSSEGKPKRRYMRCYAVIEKRVERGEAKGKERGEG